MWSNLAEPDIAVSLAFTAHDYCGWVLIYLMRSSFLETIGHFLLFFSTYGNYFSLVDTLDIKLCWAWWTDDWINEIGMESIKSSTSRIVHAHVGCSNKTYIFRLRVSSHIPQCYLTRCYSCSCSCICHIVFMVWICELILMSLYFLFSMIGCWDSYVHTKQNKTK